MTRRSVIKWEVRGVLGIITAPNKATALHDARLFWPNEDVDVQSMVSSTIGRVEARRLDERLNDRAEA